MTITPGFLAPGLGRIGRSRDGRNWTSATIPNSYYDAVWVDSLNKWVAVGDGAGTSPDGATWVHHSVPVAGPLRRLVWAGTLGLLVAVGDSGSVATSPDGETWTVRTGFGTSHIAVLAVSPTGTLVAATGDGQVRSSTNGTSWTARSVGVAFQSPQSLVWSTIANSFFLVAFTTGFPAGPVRRRSPNGVSWTHFDVGDPDEPTHTITFPMFVDPGNPDLGVAYGDGNLMVTLDGTIWVKYVVRGVPEGQRVAYSPALEVYVSTRSWSTTLFDWYPTEHDSDPVSLFGLAVGPVLVLPPFTPTPTGPVGTVNKDATLRFSWGFSSPETGDRQTKLEIRYRPTGGTWTSVVVESPNRYWDAPPGTFAVGDFEWQVRAAGVLGDWSGWSDSQFFTAAPAPDGPTILAPVDGATIGAGTALLEWSVPTQGAFQVRRVGDDNGVPDLTRVLWDSGVVAGAARERLVEFPTNNQVEHLQLRVRAGGLWTGWVSVRVEVSYTEPAAPEVAAHVFTVRGLETGLRYTVAVPAPGPGEPAVTHLEIWRRVEGEPGDGIRVAKDLAPGAHHDDYAVASGVEYEVRARVFGDNGTSSWSTWDQQIIGVLALSEGGLLELEGR